MFAREIMTTNVISITPDAPVRDIARLLVENSISALPVLNAGGEVVGMVSEGDLMGRGEAQHMERRDWWLNLLAEGEALAPEFLDNLQRQGRKAHEIMSSPVVTVTPTTDITEIAHLLTEYHIKRVPVVSDNRVIGIVSRADLVRAFAGPAAQPRVAAHSGSFLSKAFASMDRHYDERPHRVPGPPPATADAAPAADAGLSVKDFQMLVTNFEHAKTLEEAETHHKIAARHRKQVEELINHHIDDKDWQALLHHAREAAERGEKEYMLLRFPNDLCTDGGRAVNVVEQGWSETLRGEAAEIYLRWEKDLQPHGFRLSARVLEYPGGFPGDIGLFLCWGR